MSRKILDGFEVGQIPRGGLMVFGGVDDLSELMYSRLQMPSLTGYETTLEYVSGLVRYVWTPIKDRYWMRWTLNLLASGLWTFSDGLVCDIIKAWSDRDVSVTYSGAWSQSSPATALNATYSYTDVLDRYIEFSVTPGVAGKIYLVVSKLNNGGYASVTINGQPANELPQIDCYDATGTYNNRVLIASGLDLSTAYNVRVTVLHTKPVASSGYRIYFEGYGIYTYTRNDAQISALLYARKAILAMSYSSGTNECAISYKPTGASGYDWTGSGHQQESISSVVWTDGTNPVVVSVGSLLASAAQIVLDQSGKSRHSQTSTTDHADVSYRHTFDSTGLTVYHRHAWLTAATCDQAYVAMWSLRNDSVTRGHVTGDNGTTYDLTANTGIYLGQKHERLALLWNPSYAFIVWLYAPNLIGVNGWANSATYLSLEDRADGSQNKIYWQRVGGTAEQPNATIGIGDVWESTVHYRVSNLDPASLVLS